MRDEAQHLHFQSALQIAKRIAAGNVTSREVTLHFLDRIDRAGALNAFAAVFRERALLAADAADRKVAAGEPLSALHGVPVAIKDSIEWEGTTASAGSLARLDYLSTETSTAVDRLLAAGMVVIGKTQMTEFAFGLSGQNPTRNTPWNPWDATTHRAPGGSSSGSGVAIAAGLVPIALGGDTGGSVRAPATLTHLVGFKPSSGLISRAGVVPLAPSLDVLGPIARTVEDAHALTAILAGPDQADPITLEESADFIASIRDELTVTHKVVYVLEAQAFPAELCADVQRIWEGVLEKLSAAGWDLKVWAPSPDLAVGQLSDDNSLILGHEGYVLHGHLARDAAQPLWDVVRERILTGAKLSERSYQDLLARRRVAAAAFTASLGGNGTLLMPATNHGARELDPTDIAHAGIGKFTRASNFLGAPAISLPAGFDANGLPVGVQLVAPRRADKHLLDQAAQMAPILAEYRTPDLAPWHL